MLRLRPLLTALLACGTVLALPAAASAACSSTPWAAPLTLDSPGRGVPGFPGDGRIDLETLAVSVTDSCLLGFDVSVAATNPVLTGTSIAYAINSDNSAATGSTTGDFLPGQDWLLERFAQSVTLWQWKTAAGGFYEYPFQGTGTAAIGTFGASVDLQILAPLGVHDMTAYAIAGVNRGGEIHDYLPDASTVAVHVETALKVNPLPIAPPIPVKQGAADPKTAVAKSVCTVPKVTRNTLVRAKKLLRKGKCGVVSTVHRSSRTIKKGRAVRTSPKGGSVISPTTKVVLVISSGKPKKKH